MLSQVYFFIEKLQYLTMKTLFLEAFLFSTAFHFNLLEENWTFIWCTFGWLDSIETKHSDWFSCLILYELGIYFHQCSSYFSVPPFYKVQYPLELLHEILIELSSRFFSGNQCWKNSSASQNGMPIHIVIAQILWITR